jgi:hypothetical protein
MKARMRWFGVMMITLMAATLLFAAPVAARPKDPNSFQYTRRSCASKAGMSEQQAAACRLSPPTTAAESAQPAASPQS